MTGLRNSGNSPVTEHGYDPQDVRNLAAIVLEAPTHLEGGSINVWLARDLARASSRQADVLADAVSALRYIEQRYGRLDGVGWERVLS